MDNHSRRRFLSDVGKGMLVAGIGSNLAMELGICSAFANEDAASLTFGSLEPLVDLMQQTPVEKLQPALVNEIKSGVGLKTLVAAGALANARSFAGQDYVGFHTMMALMPAWRAWDVLQLVGYDHAHTLLRQSVRYCVEREQERLQRSLSAKGRRHKSRPLR